MGTLEGGDDSLISALAALDDQPDNYDAERAATAARIAALDEEFGLDRVATPERGTTKDQAARVGHTAVEHATAFPRANGSDMLRNSAFGKSPFKF